MVVLDETGEPLRPAKLWNDTESAVDATELAQKFSAEYWVSGCGSLPVAAFTVAKLRWLQRVEPDIWQRVHGILLPHDWITAQFTGQRTTDRGDASGTGYWSPRTGEYLWDVLNEIDPDKEWANMLPRVLGPIEPAGHWHGAVVAAGTGDNMAAALGLGLEVGDVVMSFGTSGTVYALSARPSADETGAVAGFADAAGRYLPLVCTLNATKVTDAVRNLLGVDHETFDRLALDAPMGAGGLTLLPYFDGERTPNRPDARGLVAGLRSDVRREHLARAAVEGVVCGLLDGLDALRPFVDDVKRVVMIGGGARSLAYRQVLADLCELPVVVADAEQAVATGACVQAAATYEQVSAAQIAARWGLGGGTAVDRSAAGADGTARDQVRHAYASVRDLSA